MTDLRTAAQQALEAMRRAVPTGEITLADWMKANRDLKAALAEPVQEPGDFDHGIGADRFKVVRGAFWWHVLIGDSPTEHGKFRSRASAEKMAADLLREFRNGAFVQHEAALAEPVQEPVAKVELMTSGGNAGLATRIVEIDDHLRERLRPGQLLYTAPSQRTPLTEEEIKQLLFESAGMTVTFSAVDLSLARAIERAHGIT